jgi:predicted transcriptional regulator
MSDLTKFWDILKAGIPDLAQQLGQQYLETALKDSNDFLTSQHADLDRWTAELAAGQLSPDDFADLVKGQADLAEMTLLKQAGLAQVQIDRFVNGVLGLVIDTAFKVFL